MRGTPQIIALKSPLINTNYTQINIIVILAFICGDFFNVNDRELHVNTR